MPTPILAVVTIVETNEVTHHEFTHAGQMISVLAENIEMAMLAFKRPIGFNPPKINGDELVLTVFFADTDEPYMIVNARRKNSQQTH